MINSIFKSSEYQLDAFTIHLHRTTKSNALDIHVIAHKINVNGSNYLRSLLKNLFKIGMSND